jgi:hypothetical protein
MQFLFAVILKAVAAIKKFLAFISKEFFLIFVYGIMGGVISFVFFLILKYAIPNKNILTQLRGELPECDMWFKDLYVLVFIYLITVLCIYLFRVLLNIVQTTMLK